MKERRLIATAREVRGMLDGTITQLRRIIKCASNSMHCGRLLGTWALSRPPFRYEGDPSDVEWRHFGREAKVGDWVEHYQTDVDDYASRVVACPYGVPGDRLWVAERFWNGLQCHTDPSGEAVSYWSRHVEYDEARTKAGPLTQPYTIGVPWMARRPGIHMPRWASRMTLEVVAVRAERLQDISEADLQASVDWSCTGIPDSGDPWGVFADVWDETHGPGSWNANPWVWACEVKRIEALRKACA